MNGNRPTDEAFVAWIKRRKVIIGAVAAIFVAGVFAGKQMDRLEGVESALGVVLQDHAGFRTAIIGGAKADSLLTEKTDHLVCAIEDDEDVIRLLKVDCSIPGFSRVDDTQAGL